MRIFSSFVKSAEKKLFLGRLPLRYPIATLPLSVLYLHPWPVLSPGFLYSRSIQTYRALQKNQHMVF